MPRKIRAVAFDLDGTLIRGPEAVPGAVEAVAALRRAGLKIAFCTQDSMRPPAEIAQRLSRLGFGAETRDVISGGWTAAEHLSARYRGERIALFASDSLRDAFVGFGAAVIDAREGQGAKALFVGRKPNFTAADVVGACNCIWNGAKLFAVGYDHVLPSKDGDLPGVGAVVKAIEFAVAKTATILGKPSRALSDGTERSLGLGPESILVVGDQEYTDIRLGKSAGWLTALVLTGGTNAAEARRLPASQAPDVVLPDVGHLPAWLEREKL